MWQRQGAAGLLWRHLLRAQTPDDLWWRLSLRDLHHRRVPGGLESGAGRMGGFPMLWGKKKKRNNCSICNYSYLHSAAAVLLAAVTVTTQVLTIWVTACCFLDCVWCAAAPRKGNASSWKTLFPSSEREPPTQCNIQPGQIVNQGGLQQGGVVPGAFFLSGMILGVCRRRFGRLLMKRSKRWWGGTAVCFQSRSVFLCTEANVRTFGMVQRVPKSTQTRLSFAAEAENQQIHT